MAGSGAAPGPKILLAKPAVSRSDVGASTSGAPAGVVKLKRERDDESAVRSRVPHGSLSLVSESWDIFPDRLLPLMSDNTDFTVVGVLGPPGVGKSTILNELYGFDGNSSGILPPFPVQSEEIKAMARHCSVGIELRMSAERFILLDTQPLFSASVLTELMRPDGSSAISVLPGETLSAELAHELMGIQLGVFLASVCHVLLLVTEGLHDVSLWRLMLTVEMLKQGIPDPTLLSLGPSGSHVQPAPADKDVDDTMQEESVEFFADTVFIHTKRNGAVQYIPPQFPAKAPSHCISDLKNIREDSHSLPPAPSSIGLQNGAISAFSVTEAEKVPGIDMEEEISDDSEDCSGVNYFVLPLKASDDLIRMQHESYTSMLRQLRDQILSIPRRPYARLPITERDWLRNASRVWDFVKKSPVLADYSRTLQNSGLYRR